MPLLLLFVFVLVPIAELYVILQVGGAIGVLPTLAILVVDSIVGSMLLRAQGRGAWRRFNEALSAGRPPAREVLDGALVIFGSAFLITPGFITDAIGLALLIPPSRAVVRGALVSAFSRRLLFGLAGRTGARRSPRPPAQEFDVEGTAVDADRDRLER